MNKKKGILIVSGGILQIPALIKAKELGFYTYLTDMKNNCPARNYADEFFSLSTKDIDGHINLAKKLVSKNKISAVYTQGADVEYTVSKAANASGLPGIDPDAALNCNDKVRMRKILNDKNVDFVKFKSAKTLNEVFDAVSYVGLPCIIKPLDNSASRGVTKIFREDSIKTAFKAAKKNCCQRKEVIIEELLIGEEYSVDTVLYRGRLYPAGISDRVFKDIKNYAVQVGSRTPSLLPEKTQKEMYDLMTDAAKALGLTDGAFKGDLILTNNHPKIIEVTARTSGGFDSQYRKPYSFGIDIIKATIDIASNNEFDPRDLIPKWFKWSMTTSVFPEPGIVKKIKGVSSLNKMKGVRNIFMDLKLGDRVRPYENCTDRVNHIIISADTYCELMELEKTVQNTLIIETE